MWKDTGLSREPWKEAGLGHPFTMGRAGPGGGMALPRCSPQGACTPSPPLYHPGLGPMRLRSAWGQGQPALGSQTFTWAMAQARLGSRGRRKIHSGLLLGHQLGRLCAKLLIVRAQQPS